MAGYRLITLFGIFFFFISEVLADSHQLDWKDLTNQQQEILGPLAEDWNVMKLERKKKWLGIAKRYPKMSLKEQHRIQSQMQSWHALTSEQRKQVREIYKKMEQLPAQKRQEIKQRWHGN